MTPVAELRCIDCGRDLHIEYAMPVHSPTERCKHRITRQIVGPEPCALCIASDQRILEENLRRNPVCTACKSVEEAEEERRAREAAAQAQIDRSGMPAPLRGLEWSDLVTTGKRAVAIAAAHKWVEEPMYEAHGLYLWGEAGTGKTRLAATAAWARMQARQPMRWVSVAVLLAKLENSFSDRERQDALKVLTGDGPLVLDDIDKVNPSESKRAQLFAAIDTRVVANVPLLVTGNLSPKQLESKLDAPIASRILGYSLGRTFEMDGPDRRMNLDI